MDFNLASKALILPAFSVAEGASELESPSPPNFRAVGMGLPEGLLPPSDLGLAYLTSNSLLSTRLPCRLDTAASAEAELAKVTNA